ncbi:hypothetical protein GJ744_000561 [Endocarpon pusillum]|uniref:Uncharacterized protein n=1 Tax=Endocarpon pusillum TaxID=364733 RepID=A0A8H7AEH2_9EURO|nr:hypothetical protein GJ744_000561 [Endocarpon pusillum]
MPSSLFQPQHFLPQPETGRDDIRTRSSLRKVARSIFKRLLLHHRPMLLQARAKEERLYHGRLRPTLRLEFTKILRKASTNVRYARVKSAETPKCGRVVHVGRSSISAVSRSGQKMKFLQHRKVRFKMDNSLLRSNGGVPGVTYRRRRYLPHIAAGVRRNWIRDLFLVYLLIHVDKLAADRRLSPNCALTHAI